MSLKSIRKAPVLGVPCPLVTASSPTRKSREEKVPASGPASKRVKPRPSQRALGPPTVKVRPLKEPLDLLWFSGDKV